MPKQFWERKDAKTEKATVAVEEEHILSIVDIEVEDKVEYEFHNDAAVRVACLDMNDALIKVQVIEDDAFVQIELGLEEEDVENEDEPNDVSQIRPTLQALSSPNMWMGDTGATKHSTKHRQGGINSQPLMSRTRGIYGQAVKLDAEVDIPGIYCDNDGDAQFPVKLQSIHIIPESHYNLISITRLMEEGHSVKANKNDGIAVEKGGRVIKFDI
jgi:hypothetical protein